MIVNICVQINVASVEVVCFYRGYFYLLGCSLVIPRIVLAEVSAMQNFTPIVIPNTNQPFAVSFIRFYFASSYPGCTMLNSYHRRNITPMLLCCHEWSLSPPYQSWNSAGLWTSTPYRSGFTFYPHSSCCISAIDFRSEPPYSCPFIFSSVVKTSPFDHLKCEALDISWQNKCRVWNYITISGWLETAFRRRFLVKT